MDEYIDKFDIIITIIKYLLKNILIFLYISIIYLLFSLLLLPYFYITHHLFTIILKYIK